MGGSIRDLRYEGMTQEEYEKKYPNRFKKGVSGNPAGRPKKGQTFPDILARVMEDIKKTQLIDGEQREMNAKELMCYAMVTLALDKKTPPAIKLKAITECKEWVDGKSVQQVEMHGDIEHKPTSIADVIDINKLTPEEAECLERVLDQQEQEGNEAVTTDSDMA